VLARADEVGFEVAHQFVLGRSLHRKLELALRSQCIAKGAIDNVGWPCRSSGVKLASSVELLSRGAARHLHVGSGPDRVPRPWCRIRSSSSDSTDWELVYRRQPRVRALATGDILRAEDAPFTSSSDDVGLLPRPLCLATSIRTLPMLFVELGNLWASVSGALPTRERRGR
jgi:hypothetical protein